MSDEIASLSVEDKMKNQLKEYLNKPLIELTETRPETINKGSSESYKWWSANCSRFKDVARVARIFLSIPASSVASERIFSAAGTVIGNRRSNLDPSQVERLVFLNQNLRSQ
jgi:hypothetical protein